MGADLIIIDNGNIESAIKESEFNVVDKAIELVGANTIKDTMASLRRWGEAVFIGFLGGKPEVEKFHFMNDLPNTIKLSFFGSGMLGSEELTLSNSPIANLAELLVNNKIPNIHSQTFKAQDIQAAHALLASNRALGKIVVTHE